MSANKRRALLLLAAFGGLVAVLGVGLALLTGLGPIVAIVALVLGAVAAAGAHQRSDAMVLSMTGARELVAGEQPRLHNVVEGLCVAAGLPKPRLFLLDDDAPNACAIGRDPKHAALVVTTGLVDKLSHIKSYDTLVSTLAATLVATVARPLPAALAARLVRRVVDVDQERLADVAGVALTRYPPGLISALEKVAHDPASLRSAPRAMAHVWIEEPATAGRSGATAPSSGRALLTRPPIEERIEALREL